MDRNADGSHAAYAHDVFLSYRRRGSWPQWVQTHFMPILEHWLGEELGREARIFRDARLESGSIWPSALATALGDSRVAVALFSGQYFSNEWCVLEFSHMRAREEFSRIAPHSLVVPATLGRVLDLPLEAGDLVPYDLADVADPWIVKDSPRWEQLSLNVREWVPAIAAAIHRAPEYDPAWKLLAVEAFVARYGKPEQAQLTVPGLGEAVT